MKKILSFLLAALMLVSMVPTALAADVDVSEGTTIKVVGTGADTYTVTVPAKLAPGESGTVKANGTWPSNQTLNVTAPSSVTLSYGDQSMDVGITFAGINQVGSDTAESSANASVAVADASALFGTWTGVLEYNVELVNAGGAETPTPDPEQPGDDDVVAAEGSATFSDGVTLSWEEIKIIENGTKYGYSANTLSDTYIGASAFRGTSLVSFNIPGSVTFIGNFAFKECSNLTSVNIPDSVTNIGKYAFGDCTNLTTINYSGTTTQWNNITLNDGWKNNIPATEVICSDGTVALS